MLKVKKEKAIDAIDEGLNEIEDVLKEDYEENGVPYPSENSKEESTSLENIEKATKVIQDKVTKLRFEDCVVTGFTQKATNTKVTLNSADFEVTVTIKDNERWGL